MENSKFVAADEAEEEAEEEAVVGAEVSDGPEDVLQDEPQCNEMTIKRMTLQQKKKKKIKRMHGTFQHDHKNSSKA
jgi:hypothetical protein